MTTPAPSLGTPTFRFTGNGSIAGDIHEAVTVVIENMTGSVTVGAGVVDPATGRVSEGRRIDPAVAKALGFETWRDWYLTDRHAEQMRLQQQAVRQRNANDARDNGTIELPSVDEDTNEVRPEQD